MHLHESNNPRERVVIKKPPVTKPFMSEKPRFGYKQQIVSPGPHEYPNAIKSEWNTKTFNINYLMGGHDYAHKIE